MYYMCSSNTNCFALLLCRGVGSNFDGGRPWACQVGGANIIRYLIKNFNHKKKSIDLFEVAEHRLSVR